MANEFINHSNDTKVIEDKVTTKLVSEVTTKSIVELFNQFEKIYNEVPIKVNRMKFFKMMKSIKPCETQLKCLQEILKEAILQGMDTTPIVESDFFEYLMGNKLELKHVLDSDYLLLLSLICESTKKHIDQTSLAGHMQNYECIDYNWMKFVDVYEKFEECGFAKLGLQITETVVVNSLIIGVETLFRNDYEFICDEEEGEITVQHHTLKGEVCKHAIFDFRKKSLIMKIFKHQNKKTKQTNVYQ